MVIYRIEHEKYKTGPYRSWEFSEELDTSEWMINNHDSSKLRPTPYDEGLERYDCHSFGFKNMTQLKRWFTKRERENLDRLGFIIAVYKIKGEAHITKHRVMFDGKSKKLIKRLALIDYKC